MIGILVGLVADVQITDNRAVMLVMVSGVGYEVRIAEKHLEELCTPEKHPVVLHTHQRVKEDGVELFGFIRRKERDFFRLLLTVSGVGPQVALSLLQEADEGTLADAIASSSDRYLAKAPGVGAKTAARIVLELQTKVHGYLGADANTSIRTVARIDPTTEETVRATLEALAYAASDINGALAAIGENAQLLEEANTEKLLSAAITWIATQ